MGEFVFLTLADPPGSGVIGLLPIGWATRSLLWESNPLSPPFFFGPYHTHLSTILSSVPTPIHLINVPGLIRADPLGRVVVQYYDP